MVLDEELIFYLSKDQAYFYQTFSINYEHQKITYQYGDEKDLKEHKKY